MNAVTADMVRDLIVGQDRARPRSRQRAIGPSDLSSPCNRKLMYQLLDVEPVRADSVNLAAWVGTQMHSGMEAALKGDDEWQTEVNVGVEVAKGIRLFGHLDAYHKPSFTIIDWKSVGPSALQKYRRETPINYETQIDLYGLLAVLSGKFRVDNVGIGYLPRNGDLSDIHVYTRPWNQDRADAAIKRLVDLHAASAAGPAVLPMIGTAPDCRFCKWHMYGHLGDPAQACGGHEEAPQTTATPPMEVTTQPTLTRGNQ